jgi:hypothetical protein
LESKFDNEILNKQEDETFALNKEVEISSSKLILARTELIYLKKES